LPNREEWWNVPEYVIPFTSILDVKRQSEGAEELAEILLCGPMFPSKLYGSMNVEVRKRDFASKNDFDTLCQLLRRVALHTRQKSMEVPFAIPVPNQNDLRPNAFASPENDTREFRLGWCGMDFFMIVGFFWIGTFAMVHGLATDNRQTDRELSSTLS
jgi:hypothetical protein